VAVDVAVAVAVAAVVGCPRHSLCFLGSTREVSVIFEWRFPFPRQAQVTESAPQARLKFIDCTLLREIFDLELGVL